jgi:two-component system LytT family sensor kinase
MAISSKRTRIAITVAWLMFVVLLSAVAAQDFRRSGGEGLWQPVLWEVSSGVSGAFLILLQRRLTRRYDIFLSQPWRWFGIQALGLPIQCLAFVPIAFSIRHGAYALLGRSYQHSPWGELFVYECIKVSIFFSLFTVILFGILSYHQLLEEKIEAERAKALLGQAQLLRLTQQMQPHFLFNALNTVSSQMREDVEKADATLVQLSDVLRATLDLSEQHQAPLHAELRLVRGYAYVMGERFSERVSIDWDIDDGIGACIVPVMSIQPLLENVFKHTVEKRRGHTAITIKVHRDGDGLLVSVSDDQGKLASGHTPGIGLRNLRERLAMLYGDAASLTLTQLAPAGVRADMRLPGALGPIRPS